MARKQPAKGGRPSAYREEFNEQARKLCLLGATDKDLADFFGVDERTVNRWKDDHPKFCQSLKAGKEQADALVASKLYRRAVGYSHKAVKIFMPANAEAPVYADYIERYPPDTTAAIFWLKNRRRGDWRDRQEVEHSADESLAGLIAAAYRRE